MGKWLLIIALSVFLFPQEQKGVDLKPVPSLHNFNHKLLLGVWRLNLDTNRFLVFDEKFVYQYNAGDSSRIKGNYYFADSCIQKVSDANKKGDFLTFNYQDTTFLCYQITVLDKSSLTLLDFNGGPGMFWFQRASKDKLPFYKK